MNLEKNYLEIGAMLSQLENNSNNQTMKKSLKGILKEANLQIKKKISTKVFLEGLINSISKCIL
jgi:hypothetical protein